MNYRTKERKLNEKYGWNKQRLECLDYIFNELFSFNDNLINCNEDNPKYKFTATDIDYDYNEYYKDGYDPHKYIEFKIKELPAWKFGIWLGNPEFDSEINKYNRYFKGYFFAQVERFISKFKPTRSPYCVEFYYTPTHTVDYEDGTMEIKGEVSSGYKIQDILKFMLEEPALAFCRDLCNWDYNTEYHTRAEAERKMKKIIEKADKCDANKKIMADRVLVFAKELVSNKDKYFKDHIKDIVLTREEEYTIPSREIYLYYPKTDVPDSDYSFDPKDDLTKEGYTFWKEWMKESKALAKKLDVCWWLFETVGLDQITLVTGKKRFNYIKKNCCE